MWPGTLFYNLIFPFLKEWIDHCFRMFRMFLNVELFGADEEVTQAVCTSLTPLSPAMCIQLVISLPILLNNRSSQGTSPWAGLVDPMVP